MAIPRNLLQEFWRGPLVPAARWPWLLRVRLGELRPAFIPKGRGGNGYRAVARNGRILVASDRPITELAGGLSWARLQTWHQCILPDHPPEPYGVLLYVRSAQAVASSQVFDARLVSVSETAFDFALEVGGRLLLAFRVGNGQTREFPSGAKQADTVGLRCCSPLRKGGQGG